jgi:uncharacterized lipoprotein YmbA
VRKLAASVLMTLALAACGRGEQPQQNVATSAGRQVPVTAAGQGGVTPMAQRVAVIGILNKRNSIVQNVTLRPGSQK